MNKEKLIKQLFVGKVSEVIGVDKTMELLKEATEAINGSDSKSKSENQITPEIIERLGLIKTDAANGVSFSADCTFWKVGDTGIWLTDYNISWKPDMNDISEANLLNHEDSVFVFNRKSGIQMKISYEVLVCDTAIDTIKSQFK